MHVATFQPEGISKVALISSQKEGFAVHVRAFSQLMIRLRSELGSDLDQALILAIIAERYYAALDAGPHPSSVYQYAISVAMSLIAGALSTQDAGYATFTRIVLTLAGAFAAAGAVALLDELTGWSKDKSAPPLPSLSNGAVS